MKQNRWLQEISRLRKELNGAKALANRLQKKVASLELENGELNDARELANRLQKKVASLERENDELKHVVEKLRCSQEAIELARLQVKMKKLENKNKKYYYKASREDIWKHHIVYQFKDGNLVKEYRTQSEAMKLGFRVNMFIDTGIADRHGYTWMSYDNYRNQTRQN